MPTVSVIIPTYNRAAVLSRAIDSVLAQSYNDFELIIVDDASTDETDIVVEQFNDNRIHYYRLKRNSGANVARNMGINKADGDYIAFLDSDDEWEHSKLDQQIPKLMASNDCEISFTSVAQLNKDGKLNGISHATASGNVLEKLLKKNVVGTFSSVVVSKKVIEVVGKPNPELPCWQDWEWYLRISTFTGFLPIKKPLTIRHNHDDQISGSYKIKNESARPIIKERIRSVSTNKRMTKKSISYLDYNIGRTALSEQKYSIARSMFFKSLLTDLKNIHSLLFIFLTGPHYKIIKKIKRLSYRIIH